MDISDVNQLVQRCQTGDEQAVETIVHMYQPLVFRLALSILDDPAEAEDATQEALLKALRALPSYRGEATFQTWLYTISVNVCRGRIRKRRARERLTAALRAIFPHEKGAIPQLEERFLHNERLAATMNAVNALDERYRLPVILRYYHRLPISEIAQTLGVSQRTVHNRLKNAHETLRAMLAESER